jgi:hypothetical protein
MGFTSLQKRQVPVYVYKNSFKALFFSIIKMHNLHVPATSAMKPAWYDHVLVVQVHACGFHIS